MIQDCYYCGGCSFSCGVSYGIYLGEAETIMSHVQSINCQHDAHNFAQSYIHICSLKVS